MDVFSNKSGEGEHVPLSCIGGVIGGIFFAMVYIASRMNVMIYITFL